MRVVGLMSGTSYDGIDAAVADLSYEDGNQIHLTPLGATSYPHATDVRELLTRVLPPAEVSIADVCRLDTLLGQAFADAAARAISELGDGHADLVVSHGQTVFHWVEDGRARGSLQLGQPAWIAERTRVPVVSDLRNRDIARGGQGAPLVPIFDALLLPPADRPRAALNLGGIANLTVISRGHDPLAYDIGPANALIDLAAQRLLGRPYDPDGEHAAAGRVDDGLLVELLDEPYYRRAAPKSTGRELFHAGYLAERLDRHPSTPARDVLATLTELTARLVADACRAHELAEVFASGGGVRNRHLMHRISVLGGPGVSVRRIDQIGVPADAKEAYAFAVLGYLSVHGVPASVPSCTGASGPAVLGSFTPGDEGPGSTAPPARLEGTPDALVVEAREDRGYERSDDRSGGGADRVGGRPGRAASGKT